MVEFRLTRSYSKAVSSSPNRPHRELSDFSTDKRYFQHCYDGKELTTEEIKLTTFPAGPGITRFELETSRSHGYLVRICRDGTKTSEFFSDTQYGGKRKAKKMAQQRYAELCEKLGPANIRPTRGLITSRNSTGMVGVHIAHSIDSRWENCKYSSYCASWTTLQGVRQKISFSWNKHGKVAAFELACLARKTESTDRTAIIKIYDRRVARRKAKAKPVAKPSVAKHASRK